MKFLPTALPEVIIVEPDVHGDARGFFLESYHQVRYQQGGIPGPFVQDNHSRSAARTLRGLHAQLRHPQGKLCRVVSGAVFDVAVDIRPDSPRFGQYAATELSAENFRQLFVPPGFAHGFCVLSDGAEFQYKCTDFYDPGDEISIAWDDPEIGIPWPISRPILSAKDASAPRLREVRDRLAAD